MDDVRARQLRISHGFHILRYVNVLFFFADALRFALGDLRAALVAFISCSVATWVG